MLEKNKNDPTKNKSYSVSKQTYEFDPELSEIYYIFEDGHIEKRNDFADVSPYRPLELLEEELTHLNG